MGTSLTGTKPKDTYDSLIKVGDNGPISGTAKVLSDGLGNDLPIAVSTSNVGIGTSSPAYKLDVTGDVRTSVASGNGSLYINNSSLTSKFWTLIPETAAGETNLLFFYGGAGAGTKMTMLAGGGLTFNGDTAAANALDDYEEGTWTPASNSAGYTISVSEGIYTKIGRQVTIRGRVTFSAVNASSTSLFVFTGLPYTPSNVYQGVCRENTDFGSIFMAQVRSVPDGVLNSMDAVTTGSNVQFATSRDYIFTITYFV